MRKREECMGRRAGSGVGKGKYDEALLSLLDWFVKHNDSLLFAAASQCWAITSRLYDPVPVPACPLGGRAVVLSASGRHVPVELAVALRIIGLCGVVVFGAHASHALGCPVCHPPLSRMYQVYNDINGKSIQ